MAFTKITTSDLNSRGATTLPNQPTISASALKQEFDAPAKEVVAPKFNNLIDELGATSAAANIGAVTPTGRTGNTVQTVINKISTDLATVESEIGEAIAEAHSHPNKELLDTYMQTEEDLAKAVVNTHSHDNKSVLDKFGEEDGQPTYDGNPIGAGDMYASDYDPDDTVKNAGGIEDYVASQAYELPTASAAVKGGIKVGTNLSINEGVLSATDTTYSDATTSASGLMSASDKTKLDGVESNANNYSLPTASTSQLGGVKVDGSTVTIDGNGVISASGGGGGGTTVIANPTEAATDDLEKVQIGSAIYEIPDTTYESKQAESGGTDESLVTTGEKYTWNEKVSKSATAGLLKNDGTVDQTQYVSDVSAKADKVSSATNGNFAGLDSNGNLTDSGSKASDFMASDGVEANPQGTATGTLTSIGINGDKYDIQGGGGGIDGSTVTPTDVIATWLECAGLHQSYTTINEVLADSGVLSALMASTNAVDYLVRSTTWAATICADELAMNYIGENNYCADVLLSDSTWGAAISASTYWEEVLSGLVPTMTSATTPSGVVSAEQSHSSYPPYLMFDGNDTTRWVSSKVVTTGGAAVSTWVQYEFPSAVRINKIKALSYSSNTITQTLAIEVQGSNDGTNFTSLATGTTKAISTSDYDYEVNFANNGKYKYYRMVCTSQVTSASGSQNNLPQLYTMQLYGHADLPPVDDRINAKADKTDIAPVENGTTASRTYVVGQQFYLSDGKLYKAKAAIAQGATFTIGTNCELAPNITDQIKALWDAINS